MATSIETRKLFKIILTAIDGITMHQYKGSVEAMDRNSAVGEMKEKIDSGEFKEDEAESHDDRWNDMERSLDEYLNSVLSVKLLNTSTSISFLKMGKINTSIYVYVVPSTKHYPLTYSATKVTT